MDPMLLNISKVKNFDLDGHISGDRNKYLVFIYFEPGEKINEQEADRAAANDAKINGYRDFERREERSVSIGGVKRKAFVYWFTRDLQVVTKEMKGKEPRQQYPRR